MSSDNVNPYELLGLSLEATEQEIKTAYRQRSLKVHPDRNRGNPDAARKFHELQQAHELLLDPLQRKELDRNLRSKKAVKARRANYGAKRKGMVEELEERERKVKKARVDDGAERERHHENERIMEGRRRLREQREHELRKEQERGALQQKGQQEAGVGVKLPPSGPLDTTVRVKYTQSSHQSLVDAASIAAALAPFGTVDESAIVFSQKPTHSKKPRRGTALVPFVEIGGAFAAVCASEFMEYGLQGVEVTWAGGAEPELIGWLKKTGQLGGTTNGRPSPSKAGKSSISTPQPATSVLDGAFSSFPSTFPDLDAASRRPEAPNVVTGLDYESLTLMHMRQAERERLAREIQEQEAEEGG